MGQARHADGPADLHVAVVGTQALDRIELIRNNRVIYTHYLLAADDLSEHA